MKAHEILEKPDSWIKGSYALDKDGCTVQTTHVEACQFCAVGAIIRAYSDCLHSEYLDAKQKVEAKINELGFVNIPQWNDAPERTHQEVFELLKRLDV